ncbi:helix-turn-helix domain-containing protein [Sphingobium wenxiniae]|nr:helix-turn-helix domain-containing protein [Sphingobium wenxiniae]
MNTLASRLRKAMADRQLDQQALAAAVGCTQGAISQILLGRTLRSRFLPDIATALGVDIEWLRGNQHDEEVADAPRRTSQTISLPVILPSAADLAEMFQSLLALVPAEATREEAAQILAERLPSGFAAIGFAAPALDNSGAPVARKVPRSRGKARPAQLR